jgi:PII-like signaling protein
MRTSGERTLLRIRVGEQDKWFGRPLHEVIVHEARLLGLAGAAAFKGFLGFGPGPGLPVLIEIVDTDEKVRALLPKLDEMVRDGLITLEKVPVVLYRTAS